MGLIGNKLANTMCDSGWVVKIVDNESNPVNLPLNKKIQVEKNNILDLPKIDSDTNLIIHLAAISSIRDCETNPTLTHRVNVEGTQHVANLTPKGCKFIFSSSVAVYNKKTHYSKSKIEAEKILAQIIPPEQLLILRLGNVFGLGKNYERSSVLIKFIQDGLNHKPLRINGSGLQTRDFIAVEDVVDTILSLNNEVAGTYNLVTGIKTSITDLAMSINSFTGNWTHHYEIQESTERTFYCGAKPNLPFSYIYDSESYLPNKITQTIAKTKETWPALI